MQMYSKGLKGCEENDERCVSSRDRFNNFTHFHSTFTLSHHTVKIHSNLQPREKGGIALQFLHSSKIMRQFCGRRICYLCFLTNLQPKQNLQKFLHNGRKRKQLMKLLHHLIAFFSTAKLRYPSHSSCMYRALRTTCVG